MKRTNYLLYTNNPSQINEEDYREGWNEWLNSAELTAEEHTLEDYIAHSIDIEWDDFRTNLESSQSNGKCAIIGSCGTWQGRRSIIPVVKDCLYEAILQCCGRSIDYLTVRKVNGHLEVSAVHHDGTNYFDIVLLNDKGINAGENADLSKRCYHMAMPEYLN